MTHLRPREPDDVLLRNGTIARIRSAGPGDREALVALHDGLSDESRYLRFFHVGQHSSTRYVDGLLARLAVGEAGAYVATVGDQLVALASFVAVDGMTADVAFVVADDVAGYGLGTLLLERLAVLAERHGVTVFNASALAANHAMLDVLRRSGFTTTATRDYETVEVTFPVHLTEEALDAIATRERRTDAASIGALLSPGSVAVVGEPAGRQPGHVVVHNLQRAGFTGSIYPVDPDATELLGLTAYLSVLDLPEAPTWPSSPSPPTGHSTSSSSASARACATW